MTKHNRVHAIRVSIKSKIWFAIVGTVAAVIGVLWLLQVVYLEEYYFVSKKNEFTEVIGEVTAAIDDEGLFDSQNKLYELAGQYVLCIDICDEYGERVVTYEGLNYNCYIHKNELRRQQFLSYAAQSQGGISVVTVEDTSGKAEYFICAVTGTTTEGSGYIVTVSVALAPVREASLVIRRQLILASCLLMAIAMAAAFWISRGLTKNILKINLAAKQVAYGDLSAEVFVDSNDELGDLANSFSEMTREISKVSVLQKELVANISHDIRTPLTMIRGYAETIKDITGNDKETRERQLDIIIDETSRLNTLVSDVMDLSLMQAGQAPLNLISFDIAKKANEILSRFELLEQTSDFSFAFEGEESLFVAADEVRIEQVLYNLINNAANHMGNADSEKRITVSVTRQENEAIISVIDTGTGIAQEDLPLIWDRYYKPYKSTPRKAVGTGLGLSIVKAILINHNARFGVTSTLGVGSRFWFTLALQTAGDGTN